MNEGAVTALGMSKGRLEVGIAIAAGIQQDELKYRTVEPRRQRQGCDERCGVVTRLLGA